MLAARHGNVTGQEVRKPCLVRVLFCVHEYCHREMVLACLVVQREGPHRRSIDAANASESMYTRNADHLMLFWRLCEPRRASNLVWKRSAQAALLATSSAVAIRTNRTAKLKEL
jgi:hypothetical protein